MSTQPTPAVTPSLPELRDDWTLSGSDDPAPEHLKPAEEKPEASDDPEEISRAASALGKKGGQAAAEKRREAKGAEEKATRAAKPAHETAEAGDEPETEEGKEKAGNPRHDPKARMLEATRKEAEAKREAAAERTRRQELERELAALRKPAERTTEPAKAQPKAETDPEPKEEDFESYADFVKAASRWGFRQELKAALAEQTKLKQAESYASAHKARIEKYQGRLAEAVKSDASFWDKVSPEVIALRPTFQLGEDEQVSALNVAADEIFSSEHGPALMLHLTDHPEDLQRLAALQTPPDIVREVARIEARLGAVTAGTSPKPRESKPNPPLRPVSGSANTADVEPGDDSSYDDFVRYHNARERRRR